MSGNPPVIRKAVHYNYKGGEVVDLVKAAHRLPIYHLDLGKSHLRIDCHSLMGGHWRCAFIFSRDLEKRWMLTEIEYDLGMTMKRALHSLGQLEEMGLKQLKHGL